MRSVHGRVGALPDANIGYLLDDWLTMGMLLTTPMIFIGAGLMIYAIGATRRRQFSCSEGLMRQYLDFLRISGSRRPQGRSHGHRHVSVFGYQMRFDLASGFPLVTTKKLHLRSIIYELLWVSHRDTTSSISRPGVSSGTSGRTKTGLRAGVRQAVAQLADADGAPSIN